MNGFVTVIVYFVVGTIGGLIGCKLKFPASTLIGACAAVIAFNLLWRQDIQLPKYFNTIAQILIGVMVGASFTPEVFKNIGHVAFMAFGTTLVLTISGLGLAAFFTWTGMADPATAFLATNPGGLSFLVPVSVEIGADTSVVFICHAVRLLAVLASTPILLIIIKYLS